MPYGQDPFADLIPAQNAPRPSNPFDQFDTPNGPNPFDRFDSDTSANAGNAAATGFFTGLPIIGPWAKEKMQELTAYGQAKATGEPYDQALKDVQGAGAASTEAYPWTSTIGRVAGAAVGGAPMVAAAGAALPAALGGAIGSGALIGGADAGAHNGWDLTSMAAGAGMGAVGGAAGKAIGSAAGWLGSKAISALRTPPSIPTADAVEAARKAAYAAVDANGTVATPQGGQRLANAVRQTMSDFGYDPALQPGGQVVLDRLDAMANPPRGVAGTTLTGVDKLRQVVANMATSGKSGAALAGRIKGNIDDFVNNPQPRDWLGADQGQGAADLANARRLAQIGYKNDALTETMERQADNAAASGSGGNAANAQAQGAKKLKWGGDQNWTPDEQAAQQVMINGAPKWLRAISKMAPAGHGLGMAATIGLGAGEAVPLAVMGHPMAGAAAAGTAAIPAAAGTAAKRLVEAMGNSREQALRATILNGGINPYAPNAAQRLIGRATPYVNRLLTGAGATAGGPLLNPPPPQQ